MKAELGKFEPIFREEIDPEGNKAKVRKLKLSLYVDVLDFPDVTAYDGAELDVFRPDEYKEIPSNNVSEVKKQVMNALDEILEVLKPIESCVESEKRAVSGDRMIDKGLPLVEALKDI